MITTAASRIRKGSRVVLADGNVWTVVDKYKVRAAATVAYAVSFEREGRKVTERFLAADPVERLA